MLLRHRTGAYIRSTPYTRCDCWVARDVLAHNEYHITPQTMCDRVVDVGANIGCFGRKVLELHPHAEIACVEPLVEHLECLRANAPSATIIHAAVAYGCEEVAIYAPREEVHSPFQQGTGMSIDKRMHGQPLLHCTVPAITLRGILDRMDWDEADLLKIDCERCEFDVFQHLDELACFHTVRGEYHDLPRMRSMLPAISRKFEVTISGEHPRGKFWMERLNDASTARDGQRLF